VNTPEPQADPDPCVVFDPRPVPAPPWPMETIHAIVDCAYQLPPGTAAARWAALTEPRTEPDLGHDYEGSPEYTAEEYAEYQARAAGREPEAGP
jgi:hypothetical protein